MNVGSIESGATVTNSDGVTTTTATGASARALWSEYIPYIYALAAILGGNITLQDTGLTNSQLMEQYSGYGTTNILGAGLMAYDEIANTPSKNESSYLVRHASAPFTNMFTSTTQHWLCQNRTLARGIEDLANNITITYLSSPGLTSDGDLQNIVTSNTSNYYVYHPLLLLLLHGLALLFSALAVAIGVYAIRSNGVVHSNSFSANLITRRNTELDAYMRRSSLDAEPLQSNDRGRRLKFGPVVNQATTEGSSSGGETGSQWETDEKLPYIAFGLEENIGQLRKGELYI